MRSKSALWISTVSCIIWQSHGADECSTDYPTGLFKVCSGVVDYPFFLADGTTVADLDILARTSVGIPDIDLLPTACKRDVKVLVCANVYKKCVTGVDFLDDSTWTSFTYPVGVTSKLAYERPCSSLCTATTASGTTCDGLLEDLGSGFDCIAIDTDTNFPQYADSPDACNTMSVAITNTAVAAMKETYNTAGICQGVVGTEVWIPPPSNISPAFSPMLPPGVVQAILEGAVATKVNSLPVFIAQKCLVSARKLMCGAVFMNPEHQTNLPSTLPDVYMPQYPAKSVCEDYQSDCAGLIALVASKGGNAAQNCTAQTNGIYSYPEVNQLIRTVNIPGAYELRSDPNTMSNAVVEVETLCPHGFTVPENPTKHGVTWIPGTGCALKCPPPLLTDREYDIIQTLAKVYTGMALPCGIFLVLTWSVFKKKRKQPIVLALAIQTTLISIIFSIQFMIAPEAEERFCSDNAVSIRQSDGGLCIFQAITLGYFSMGIACWWLCQAFDVYIKAVKQLKNVEHYIRYYCAFSITFPLVTHVIPRLVLEAEGYEPGFSYCFTSADASPEVAMWTLYYPVAFLVAIGFGLMVAVLHAILKSVMGQGGSTKDLKMFQTPIIFVLMLLINWIIMFFMKGYSIMATPAIKASFLEWAACNFGNFNGIDDSYKEICGPISAVRMPFGISLVIVISIYTQCIPLFVTYGLSKENYKLWGGYFGILSGPDAKVSTTLVSTRG